MKILTEGHKYSIGVYAIRNTVNFRVYIGSTAVGFQARYLSHRWKLQRGIHGNHKLQNDFFKFGSDCFVFDLLEITSRDLRLEREKHWIDSLNAVIHGYNICKNPTAVRLGARFSDESKQKMRMAKLGKKLTPEHIQAVVRARTGAKHSAESKAKMSISASQRSSWSKGKHFSEIHRQRISQSHIGKHQKEIRCLNTGIIYSGVLAAAADLKINRRAIGAILSGKRESFKGFKFSVTQQNTN